MSVVDKYLNTDLAHSLAEPEVNKLDGLPGCYTHGLVIPIYLESTSIISRFADFSEKQSATLLILVVNQPDNINDTEWAKAFFQHERLSKDRLRWKSNDETIGLYSQENDSAFLVIDRCLKGKLIPFKQGVGLARKIGADILCMLIHRDIVKSSWIANTDADAHLPENYFHAIDQIDETKNNAAIVFPYQHIAFDDTYEVHTLLYEFSLHYYVAGLRFAESPYAYQTLGSTICTNYRHYSMVRGFPKRAGAEDFYLLNKLAKTGDIVSLQKPAVSLEARASARVPFGTGPAVSRLSEIDVPTTMPIYHPDVFLYLKILLQSINRIVIAKEDFHQTVRQIVDQNFDFHSINVEQLTFIMNKMDFQSAIDHSFEHGKKVSTRKQHLQQWFDGFKTLKFIHEIRDTGLANISFQHWQEQSLQYELQNSAEMKVLIKRITSLTN